MAKAGSSSMQRPQSFQSGPLMSGFGQSSQPSWGTGAPPPPGMGGVGAMPGFGASPVQPQGVQQFSQTGALNAPPPQSQSGNNDFLQQIARLTGAQPQSGGPAAGGIGSPEQTAFAASQQAMSGMGQNSPQSASNMPSPQLGAPAGTGLGAPNPAWASALTAAQGNPATAAQPMTQTQSLAAQANPHGIGASQATQDLWARLKAMGIMT